jgi:putative transposase
MDLFGRRIVGWHASKRTATNLIGQAFLKAHRLRQPPNGLAFHIDIDTSKRFRSLLKPRHYRVSMGGLGACWDNGVVKRFIGSLKHNWLPKIAQPTREHMRQNVAAYVKYYNLWRLHPSNGDQSPIKYENSFRKVPGWT